MTSTKPLRTWVYLDEEDQARLKKLKDNLGSKFDSAQLLSEIVSAGLRTSADGGYRLPRPLTFSFVDTALEARSTALTPRKT